MAQIGTTWKQTSWAIAAWAANTWANATTNGYTAAQLYRMRHHRRAAYVYRRLASHR